MARLPQLGGDSGSWGDILNDYLLQSHTETGVLKPNVVGSTQLASNAVTASSIVNGSITETLLDTPLKNKINASGSGAVSSVNTQVGAVVLSQDDIADGTTAKQYSATEKAKLAGIASGATANVGDVTLNGTQTLTNKTIASPAITGTPTGLTKAHVGLSNVDNTADADKPISTATQTALNAKLASSGLDNAAAALVGTTSATSTAINSKISTATANFGDVTLNGAQTLTNKTIAAPIITGTPVGITKTHVGLSAVDNTSDIDKPISTATQAALDAKLATSGLDSATAALVGTSSATATAINSKISTATAGTTSIYVLAASDPDPAAGSPAGLYFRRSS